MFDVAIVGAGPAGATLARLIGKQYRVLLLEKRMQHASDDSFNTDKCCGGLLAPDAQNMLGRMRLGIPRNILVGPQLFAVRAIDMGKNIERHYQRHYLNMDRNRFDRWLISLIPQSVDIRFGCHFVSADEDGGRIRLRYRSGGAEYTESARLLVGADGAGSRLRGKVLPRNRSAGSYIAIQEWFESRDPLPYFSAIFDREITDFYSWTIPKNGTLVLGSALLPRERVHQRFDLLKSKLGKFGFDFSRPIKRTGALLLRPDNIGQVSHGNGRVLLIGEAGGWISPSSAEGLSYAFRSALALSQSLAPGLELADARYKRNTIPLKTNIALKNCKSFFMYNPMLRRLIMKSGFMGLAMVKEY